MDNEDTQLENLENLTQEQLEALEEQNDSEDSNSEPTVDYKAKYEAEQKRAATLQRLLNKKGDKTNNNQTNKPNEELERDIAEIKFSRKVDRFAEDNNLTKSQAEKVLKLYPNATAEILKDPFVAEGIKAVARNERVERSIPGAGKASTTTSKSFSEMTPDEKKKWYAGV